MARAAAALHAGFFHDVLPSGVEFGADVLPQRNTVEEPDPAIEPEVFGELDEVLFQIAISVDMEIGVGEFGSDPAKGFDRDVQALVPLESPGEKDQATIPLARPRPRMRQ